ncbi:ATP/GTP-binding protein [Vibrio fluvialis]
MLLRYGCENFRSISDYQEILLTAAPSKDESDDNLIDSGSTREKLLPIIEIYGGNGSGKTNLLHALRFIVNKILTSARGNTERMVVPKFRLDDEYRNKKSVFDIDFIFQDTHYHYGFSVNNGEVLEEWLYQITYIKRKSTSTLFYRNSELRDEGQEFVFGKGLKGNNKNIASVTDKGCLFFSMAAKSNHPLFTELYNFFENNFEFRFSVELMEQNIGRVIIKNKVNDEISNFLSLVDVGAVRVEVTEQDFDDTQMSILKSINGWVTDVAKTLGKDVDINPDVMTEFIEKEKENKISIVRRNSQGKHVNFSFNQESLGTRALISFLASAFNVLKNGGIFVVDEVESSLHTLLTLKLVGLFSNKHTNPNGAQILFSTHETQLMNFEGVRRDEIWLTEKCFDGSTKVASLLDYSIDKRSNWRKGYIEGRFGAVPILGYVDNFNLFGGEDDE